MSYRKPVPTYIPSPPSSPRQSESTLPPSTQPNLDLEVPPLPPNWREVLDQVGMLPPRPNAESCQLLPTVTGECIEMDMTELASSVVSDFPGNLTVYGDQVVFPGPDIRSTSNIPWTQKRRLHQQYRPPTPPIPSQHKLQQSLLNTDSNSEVTLTHDVHRQIDHFGLYHDYPRGGPGASSLKISSSFRMMGSFNTSNPSVAWFQGITTGELSNYSSLLNQGHDHHLLGIAGDTSESVEPSCWESLGAWAKKLWNFVIICK